MKKIISILCILILVLGVSGCMGNRAEDAKSIALKYLTEKYDDEFLPKGYQKDNWAYDYEVITFKSSKYNKDFSVYLEAEDLIYDNYYTLYMENDAEQFYKQIVSSTESGIIIKVRFNDDYVENEIDFKEYIEQEHSDIDVCIIHSNLISEDIKKKIIDDFIERDCKETISFIYVDDTNDYISLSVDEILNGDQAGIISVDKYVINDDKTVKSYGENQYK